MHAPSPGFVRTAAVCSVLSALTTLCLIFLPDFYQAAEGFEGRMARVYDPAYRVRSLVYLVHPFLTVTAALAIAACVRVRAPALALVGALGFMLWAFTEAGQQTLTLFAFDKWRMAWAGATETERATIRVNTAMYDGLWDAMYALLLIGFAIGNLCLGWVLVRATALARVVGAFLLAASALTFCLLAREFGWFTVPERILAWSYPALQPLGRVLIGVWLWRQTSQ